jgi:serine/threonine protein kinase
MVGRTLSDYRILSEISRGGMGIVYRALDLKLDREVALKVLPTELVTDP